MCIYTYKYTYMHIYDIEIYVSIYMNIYKYIYVYRYVCIYEYIYIHIYMYTYICKKSKNVVVHLLSYYEAYYILNEGHEFVNTEHLFRFLV